LNTVLHGHQYAEHPHSLTLKQNGKLITLYSREIAINMVKDEDEADNILEWLKKEINNTWEKRGQIKPSYKIPQKPRILEILKLLPKSNCRECGQPTCMVFASMMAEAIKDPEDCLQLDFHSEIKLKEYLGQF